MASVWYVSIVCANQIKQQATTGKAVEKKRRILDLPVEELQQLCPDLTVKIKWLSMSLHIQTLKHEWKQTWDTVLEQLVEALKQVFEYWIYFSLPSKPLLCPSSWKQTTLDPVARYANTHTHTHTLIRMFRGHWLDFILVTDNTHTVTQGYEWHVLCRHQEENEEQEEKRP